MLAFKISTRRVIYPHKHKTSHVKWSLIKLQRFNQSGMKIIIHLYETMLTSVLEYTTSLMSITSNTDYKKNTLRKAQKTFYDNEKKEPYSNRNMIILPLQKFFANLTGLLKKFHMNVAFKMKI